MGFLFPFTGETKLHVRVRDKRSMQAVLRGDPLIGEATFMLDHTQLREGGADNVFITRGSEPAGKVSLQYGLVPVTKSAGAGQESPIPSANGLGSPIKSPVKSAGTPESAKTTPK